MQKTPSIPTSTAAATATTAAGETEPPNATTISSSSSLLHFLSLKNPLKTMQKTPAPSSDGSKIFVHRDHIKAHPPLSPPATVAVVVTGETEPPDATAAAVVVAGETDPPNATADVVVAGEAESPNATTVGELVAENAVIVFGQRGCCMCHVVKLLLLGLGVNPTISAVEEGDVGGVVEELLKISAVDGGGEVMELPVVYVGGKLFGGLERVMATHITGELVPLLKEANALWL